MTALETQIRDVLRQDACTGCGLCARLDPGVRMELDDRGYLRPRVEGASTPIAGAEQIFERSCPGRTVDAPQRPEDATPHRLLGAHLGIWQAWATNDDIRAAGSSGGVLTAIHAWLVSQGRAATVTGAAGDPTGPRRTVPVTITTRADALAAAGSRYAPVGSLDNSDALRAGGIVTGKPCEIAALRRAAPDLIDGEPPLLLSFFCAGTPSQHATDRLLEDLGVAADEPVSALRYRGNGWPGRFSASAPGRTVSADYDESWGRTLGPTTQWRCKICPDGVGESADIVCADSWATDERGYPTFVEGDGVSALIARTPRGLAVVQDALAAGVIAARPLDIEQLASAQPLQVTRRRFLFARLAGARLAGRGTPRYRGFGLFGLTARAPRTAVRVLMGAYRRVREQRRIAGEGR
ncbi:Coenzyme F420 hydrogenase/dehydrogenase, beta subunit C-terminal domain [Microbacterium sp. NPDC056234]|uniref:Coenzyme F420 hydrogenase/dehydrogenase, beta subunit C-terminal domain n=1 Tax=Microbacterium sp. NPDC056234 TaxID=3345757 RepID=UPI0035DDF3B6